MTFPRDTSNWLESAADLLAEPDPGPTPFVVDELIVRDAIFALQGRHKTGKSWVLLDLAVSIVAGKPALGRFPVEQGPVILVLEESGRTALHRRIAQICRARGIKRADLGDLHFAANRRVQLDDEWRSTLLRAAEKIEPVFTAFDPLARLKGPTVDESSQREIAGVLDLLRQLRDQGTGAVGFVHHTGHDGLRLRGSSDLEAYWESKLSIARSGPRIEIHIEHREAEAAGPYRFQLQHGEALQAVDVAAPDLGEAIVAYLREHPDCTFNELRSGIGRRAQDTRSHLDRLEEGGKVYRRPSEQRDRAGRARTVDRFSLTAEAGSSPFPVSRNGKDAESLRPPPLPRSRPFRAGTGTGEGGRDSERGKPRAPELVAPYDDSEGT